MSSPIGASFAEPISHTAVSVSRELARELCEIRRRPAFCGPVLGPWTQRDCALSRPQAERRERCAPSCSDAVSCGRGSGSGKRSRGSNPSARIALRHLRQRRFVQRSHVVQRQPAHFATISCAPRDSRVQRHERGLERVRQNDRLLIAFGLAARGRAARRSAKLNSPCSKGLAIVRRTSGIRLTIGNVHAGASTSSSRSR